MKTIKLGIDNGNYNTKSSEHLLHASGFTVSDRCSTITENCSTPCGSAAST